MITSWVPVEGKSSACAISMKYRKMILIIIIISRDHARTRTHAHTRAHEHPTHHRRCSLGRCAQLRHGWAPPFRPLFDAGETMFFRVYKMLGRTETRTRGRMYCQTIRTVRYISRDDRARIATCRLRTPTDLRRIIV